MNRLFKKITAVLTASVVALSLTISVSASDLESALNDARWNEYVQESIDADNTPGTALCVVNGEEVAYKNWGCADINANIPVTEDTVFEIASCSKAFTALSIFLLQEEGKLSIEDSVSDYIPWWHVTYQGKEADVKIWMLLNHCAGIPNGETMAKAPFGEEEEKKEQTARIAENLELSHAPGEAFEYCNLDYVILAYLTETVSGIPFSDYVTQEIFQPLGMINSGYDIPTTQGYKYFFGRVTEYDAPRMKGSEGDGYAITTAADMTLWMKAQLGMLEIPEKLSNAIAASHEMPEKYAPSVKSDTIYYNGWILFDSESGMLCHSGMNPNFTSMLIIDPEKQTGVFAVSNISCNTNSYAAYSLYGSLIGTDEFFSDPIGRGSMSLLDLAASVGAIIIAALVLLCIILLITQKKRLARKQVTIQGEKKLLIIRLVFLLLMLGVSVGFPYLLGFALGYPGFGYAMIAYWAPHSVMVLCGALDILTLCLITISIARFIFYKRSKQ